MKKNPALFGLLITIGIAIISYTIYLNYLQKVDTYLITNPSEDYLEVKIDDQEYKLAPNQNAPIKLRGGDHSLSFTYDGKQTDTIFNIKRANAIINPTRAEYYVFVRPYGAARNVDSLFTSQTITIDEKVYNGNITRHDGLYIEDFYYNLNHKYPKLFIKKGGMADDLSKIFTKDDFIQFYFENYE
jgi:hypothetical protein